MRSLTLIVPNRIRCWTLTKCTVPRHLYCNYHIVIVWTWSCNIPQKKQQQAIRTGLNQIVSHNKRFRLHWGKKKTTNAINSLGQIVFRGTPHVFIHSWAMWRKEIKWNRNHATVLLLFIVRYLRYRWHRCVAVLLIRGCVPCCWFFSSDASHKMALWPFNECPLKYGNENATLSKTSHEYPIPSNLYRLRFHHCFLARILCCDHEFQLEQCGILHNRTPFAAVNVGLFVNQALRLSYINLRQLNRIQSN